MLIQEHVALGEITHVCKCDKVINIKK